MAKISNLIRTHEEKKNRAIANIKKVYLSDERPWIIGYSGGKDSSAVVHLLFQALLELPREQRNKKIYIISSDTLVETPLIKQQLVENLKKMNDSARQLDIPLTTHLVHPKIKDTFWVNIIGKGYPSPNQSFRWCTDRMKIEPTNQFIKDVVDDQGEVVMLLGVRRGESSSRDRVLDNHGVENSLLMKHTTLTNAFVFAPIMEYEIEDVWNTLLNTESPWGADNNQLFKLYSDSNSVECPLIVDKSIKETAGSCGNSRFGCWVCTVVNEDKALSGFINSGTKWLTELLEFRNWLTLIRDDREMRTKARTNGSIYFMNIELKGDKLIIAQKGKRTRLEIGLDGIDSKGETWKIFNSKNEALTYMSSYGVKLGENVDPKIIAKDHDGYCLLGLGPFTIESRKEILRRLLHTQRAIKDKYNVDYELISLEEIIEIGKIWLSNGVWDSTIKDIYEHELGTAFTINRDELSFLSEDDLLRLERVCANQDVDINLMKKMLYVEKNNIGLTRRENALKEIKRLLNQDITNL